MKHLLTTLTTIFVAVVLLCTFCLPAEAKEKGAICNAGEVVIGIDRMGGIICDIDSGIPPTYSYGEHCANDDLASAGGCDFHQDGHTGGIFNQIIFGLQCPDPDDRMLAGGCDCSPRAASDTQERPLCRITASRPVSSNWVGGEEAWTCTADDAELMHVYVYCADVDGDGPRPIVR